MCFFVRKRDGGERERERMEEKDISAKDENGFSKIKINKVLVLSIVKSSACIQNILIPCK